MCVLSVDDMFPVTLGANIGATSASMLAALTENKRDSFDISCCHFLLDIIGILKWFPIPFMWGVPIRAAKLIGYYAGFHKPVSLAYILTAILAAPAVLLLTTNVLAGNSVLGSILFIIEVGAAIGFDAWWICFGGAFFWMVSEE